MSSEVYGFCVEHCQTWLPIDAQGARFENIIEGYDFIIA